MPTDFKKNKNEQPDVDEGNDKWNPTPQQFDAFLVRDEQLAAGNVRMALNGRYPVSLKEIKDSTLHSSDVIERVLTSGVASGAFLESKGKYSLTPRAVR
jgi:hypothetical protein